MRIVSMVVIMVILVVACLLVVYILNGALGGSPKETIRELGQFFINNTYNAYNRTWWAGSPEAVIAILWDYRGLDTIFETVVLYLAIIGCSTLALLHIHISGFKLNLKEEGLTLIVKTVVKIVLSLIMILAINLTLRGHISPGGGFVGGSAFAIAPLLIIAGYSVSRVMGMGYKYIRSVIFRSMGLVVLSAIALIPLVCLGYILQNQAKPYTMFQGFPTHIGPIYIAGTLLLLNLGELLVVLMEFIIVFLLISIPEYIVRGIGGDDRR